MPVRVLMVCLGNICRSPLAQGILESLTVSQGWHIDSAGTANYHIGKPPDPRSISVAASHGIDISKQKCRQFTISDFDLFDYILIMDRENQKQIAKMARNASDLKKVMLILEGNGITKAEVPDPYYGSLSDFEAVYQILHQACLTFIDSKDH